MHTGDWTHSCNATWSEATVVTIHGTKIDLISHPFQVNKLELFLLSIAMYTPDPSQSKNLKILSLFLQNSLEMNFSISQMSKILASHQMDG